MDIGMNVCICIYANNYTCVHTYTYTCLTYHILMSEFMQKCIAENYANTSFQCEGHCFLVLCRPMWASLRSPPPLCSLHMHMYTCKRTQTQIHDWQIGKRLVELTRSLLPTLNLFPAIIRHRRDTIIPCNLPGKRCDKKAVWDIQSRFGFLSQFRFGRLP